MRLTGSSRMSKVEQMAMFGMVLLALAFIFLLLTGCTPANTVDPWAVVGVIFVFICVITLAPRGG